MKNRNNRQILQRILSKSDQIMNGIINLSMQISTQSSLFRDKDERSLLVPHNSGSNTKEIDDYRNILMEQFKEPPTRSFRNKKN